jgi:hypothetical protein
MSGEDVVQRLRNFAIASRPELSAIADEVEALLSTREETLAAALAEAIKKHGARREEGVWAVTEQYGIPAVAAALVAALDATPDPVVAAEELLTEFTNWLTGHHPTTAGVRGINWKFPREFLVFRAEHTTEGT